MRAGRRRAGAALLTALLTALLLAACGAAASPPAPPTAPAVSVAPASTAEFPPTARSSFQQALDSTRARLGFPGAIAGVWGPSASWVGSTGIAGRSDSRPPARGDHSRIGSITKTFTVMLLLRQVDRGLAKLDDVIGTYVPGVPNADTATLRMLASMTSGIPDYSDDPEFVREWTADRDRVFTPAQLVDYVSRTPALFPAGTRYSYSNTNSVLLGMVIEKVTGRPFGEVLRTDLLEPLGLTGTTFADAALSLPAPALQGETVEGAPVGTVKAATDWNATYTFSAGAMASTIDDLRVWAQVLATGGGLISPDLQQQRLDSLALAKQVDPNAEHDYGLGFDSQNGWIGHNGQVPGYTAWLGVEPRTGHVIAVLVNSDGLGSDELPADAVADALGEALEDS